MQGEFNRRRCELEKRFPVWERMTLGDRFDQLAEQFSDREFIYTSKKSYSYNEVKNMSDLLAKGLLKLGIKNREHVAVSMANYPEFIFLTFALAKIGAVKVPVNYRLRSDELSYILAQSDAVCLVIMDKLGNLDYLDILKSVCPEILEGKPCERFPLLRHIIIFSESGNVNYMEALSFNDVIEQGKELSDSELADAQSKYPDEVVDILYTSGTTGKPKGVMVTHDNLWRSAYGSCLNRAFEDGRRIFIPIPYYHVFGYVEGILAGSLVGGCIIPQIAFDAVEALRLIQDGKANDMLCVSTVAINLINCPELKNFNLSCLRATYCAGTPTPLWTWQRIQDELGLTELNTGYGMTEVCAGSMQTAPGDSIDVIANRVGRQMPGGSSGLPEFDYKHTEYKVIDPYTGKNLPAGSEGELACRGNIVTKGYYNKPLETNEVIDKDGWLRTGDIAIIHKDGYFQLTGRSKEIYRIAGENVSPKEIEDVLDSHPKVYRSCVIGVPNKKLGEVGMAFIETAENCECMEEEILDYCRKKLAHFKVPKYIKFVDISTLPMTTSLKIKKVELREMVVREMNLI